MLANQSSLLRFLLSFLLSLMMLLLLFMLPQGIKAKVEAQGQVDVQIKSSVLFTTTAPITSTEVRDEKEGVAIFKPVEPVSTAVPVSQEVPHAEEAPAVSEPITETLPVEQGQEQGQEGAFFIPIEPTPPTEAITPTELIDESMTPTEVITPAEAIGEVMTPTEAIGEPIMPTEAIGEPMTPTEVVELDEQQLLTATLPISDSAAVTEEEPPIVISASLNAPANIACLPFALASMTEYNGNRVNGPYLREPTQTVITWQDLSETESSYQVERQVADEAWQVIASLPPDSTLHTDQGLEPNQRYRYRVRATEGEAVGAYSNVCAKPLFLDTASGHFRLFYRPDACPSISDEFSDSRGTCFGNVEMVQQLGLYLESARLAMIEFGFKDPVRSAPMPVDLFPCDGVGCAVVSGGRAILLSPDFMQASSQTSLWAPMHELFHHAQGAYPGLYDPNYEWITEGQARLIQDQLLGGVRSSNYREEVNRFLANPNQPITESSYQAALFWTYLTQQYSTPQKAKQEAKANEKAQEERDSSFDFLLNFWQNAQANRGLDGIGVINQTLSQLGIDERFRDVFKNFAVTNYTKAMANVPAQYQYIGLEAENSYRAVPLALNIGLTAKQEINSQSDVVGWGSRYFRIKPDSSVPAITFAGVAEHEIYYTLLGLKNGEVVKELNHVGTVFTKTLSNNSLDEMVLVVVGLEQESKFEFSFSATESSALLSEIRRILLELPRSNEAQLPEQARDEQRRRPALTPVVSQ